MAASHFTTIPYEHYTAYKAQRKPFFFTIFVLVLKALSSHFITFLYVLMNVAKVFVRQKAGLNVFFSLLLFLI